jgi:hypothetical protein
VCVGVCVRERASGRVRDSVTRTIAQLCVHMNRMKQCVRVCVGWVGGCVNPYPFRRHHQSKKIALRVKVLTCRHRESFQVASVDQILVFVNPVLAKVFRQGKAARARGASHVLLQESGGHHELEVLLHEFALVLKMSISYVKQLSPRHPF